MHGFGFFICKFALGERVMSMNGVLTFLMLYCALHVKEQKYNPQFQSNP